MNGDRFAPIRVRLEPFEVRHGVEVGTQRQATAYIDDLYDFNSPGGDRENTYDGHARGAIGEVGLAKWSGRYWPGNWMYPDRYDVGKIQVRAARRHSDRLLIRKRDIRKFGDAFAETPFALVTGDPPVVIIQGWILGKDALEKGTWEKLNGKGEECLCVGDLNRDMDELLRKFPHFTGAKDNGRSED